MSKNTYIAKHSSPSNIAIVKYWGKHTIQEPLNPSISFTLTKSYTETKATYISDHSDLAIQFFLDDQERPDFLPKINTFISRVKNELPFLDEGQLRIESRNTFPHSSGIASSASAMAALTKTFSDIQQQWNKNTKIDPQKQSSLARLGSGSACRSIKKGWIIWGKTQEVKESSNKYGCEINKLVHPLFNTLQDTILLIDDGEKKVSSSAGHQLMIDHPFKEGRIKQANKHISELLKALKEGDFSTFSRICESEALSLHGLMMSSNPSYTLLAPNSLRAIEKINQFRKEHQLDITYTLDAGPNIHLIYPENIANTIKGFIENELKPLCSKQQVIYDQISLD